MKSTQARIGPVPGVALAGLALGLLGCSAPRPPSGDELHLKGAKGAQCITAQDCESGECRRCTGYRCKPRCTEKIEKAGLGGSCRSDLYCQKGFYCDLRANRCAPLLRCDQFLEKMKECIPTVYLKFRPQQARRLQRMKGSARIMFLNRILRILYKGLCTQTRSRLPYRKGALLLTALKQRTCPEFAKYFHAAIGNKG